MKCLSSTNQQSKLNISAVQLIECLVQVWEIRVKPPWVTVGKSPTLSQHNLLHGTIVDFIVNTLSSGEGQDIIYNKIRSPGTAEGDALLP